MDKAKCYVCKKVRLFTDEHFMIKDEKLTKRCIHCTDDSERYQKYLIRARAKWKRKYEGIKDTPEYKTKNKAKSDRYRANNLDKERARSLRYIKEHPERHQAAKKRYEATENGRKKLRAYERIKDQRKRALMKGLEFSLTTKQWEDCKSFFNNCCAYCGSSGDITMDHFIPVARGGESSRDNILPVCHACNSKKQAQDFFEWYPSQSFYSQTRERKLLKYLNYQGVGIQQRTLLG